MIKLLGAAAIFAAALVTYREVQRGQQRQLALLAALRDALEDTAAAIRSLRLPLPDALARQADRPYCGAYFCRVCSLFRTGTPLPEAWAETFSDLRGQEGRIMRSVTLQGDETLLLEQLNYAAALLMRQESQARQAVTGRKKVQLAAALSLALLLAIILL